MLKTAFMTSTAALFVTGLTMTVHAPAANADIGYILDLLEEFDDLAEDSDDDDCEYVRRAVKVKVWTGNGPRWVWTTRRVKDCD